MSSEIETWCDETLPELYDEGMFDLEDTHEEVWEAVAAAIEPLGEEIADELMEAARAWFRGHHDTVVELLEPLSSAAVDAICNKPQTAQHSADWYSQRRNRLTASEFAQILDGKRAALLRQKLSTDTGDRVGFASPVGIAQADGEMNATTWGHRFEPLTRRIYELEIAGPGTVNDGLGRFTHATIPWLSASPDGLVVKGPLRGRLVEIKSPKTRKPGEFVPDEYYVQMQIQMEVCDLDAVDFVEAQFAQRPEPTVEDMEAIRSAAWKGRIEVRGYLEDSSSWRYIYTDPVEDLEDATFASGLEALPLLESSVWWLLKDGWYPRTVLRNREWWRTVGWPNAQLFWAEVESLRINQPPAIKDEGSSGWIGS